MSFERGSSFPSERVGYHRPMQDKDERRVRRAFAVVAIWAALLVLVAYAVGMLTAYALWSRTPTRSSSSSQ